MLGDRAEKIARTQTRQAGEPLRNLGMQLALIALEHRIVGDLVQDLVMERVFAQLVIAHVFGRIGTWKREFALH